MSRHGDKALDADAQGLAADPANIAYAIRIASRWSTRFPRMADDFRSAALMGVVEAASSFDPARGLPFRAFANRRIVGAIKDAARSSLPKGYRRKCDDAPAVLSMSTLTCGDGSCGRDEDLGATLPADVGDPGWELESIDAIRGLVKCLPRKHAAAVRLYYTECGMNMKRVAEAAGLSESRVSQLIIQGIGMLRDKYREDADAGLSGDDDIIMSGVSASAGEPAPERQSLGVLDKIEIRRLHEAHPDEPPGQLADRFCRSFGWRPWPAAVGRVINTAAKPDRPPATLVAPRPRQAAWPTPQPATPAPAATAVTPTAVNAGIEKAVAELDACKAILLAVAQFDERTGRLALRRAAEMMGFVVTPVGG